MGNDTLLEVLHSQKIANDSTASGNPENHDDSGHIVFQDGQLIVFAFRNVLESRCDCMQAYIFICITFISCLVLSCTVLYCLVLSCTVLYCIVLSVTSCTVLVLVLVLVFVHLCAFLRISPMDSQKRNAHRHRQNSFTLYCIAWL